MDLFFNIDWQNLKNILDEIEQIALSYHPDDAKDKIALTERFYLIEKNLAQLKMKLGLPQLNSLIDSESVITSLKETPIDNDIFNKDKSLYKVYLRQNDYQYWLLIYLLLKNNSIRTENLTLYEIIDDFIDRIKDKSFTWKDIEYTGSGATRTRTNLRFTFGDLKKIGLVNLYDQKHKNSWTLTYFGFFVAASFCLDPVDRERDPFSKRITSFASDSYLGINTLIWERILDLSKSYTLSNFIHRLKLDNLGLKELAKGPEIFGEYHDFAFSLESKLKTESKREKALSEFLGQVNQKYKLDEYMSELSMKFNSEAFFNDLIKKAKLK